MKDFKSARTTYDDTIIPANLNSVVQTAISKSSKHCRGANIMKRKKLLKFTLAVAAAIVLTFTIGLNTSQVFAMELQELPVIGPLAKLLTIRSYETIKENETTVVTIPAIVDDTTSIDATNRITDVNAEIERICDNYVTEAQTRADEYKTAFLETGGTPEEWATRDMQISVDYEIKSQTKDSLSFILYGTESWTSAYAEAHYYNLNLKTGEVITLENLLGSDYIEKANETILAQMKKRLAKDNSLSYFDESMDGFTTITEHNNFYINDVGNPVIVFAKYEIAPGSAGSQEFEILK